MSTKKIITLSAAELAALGPRLQALAKEGVVRLEISTRSGQAAAVQKRRITNAYTYRRAQWVVYKLGITSESDYHLRHQLDSRLPSRPETFYQKTGEWTTWEDFTRPRHYTFLEALVRVRVAGIRNSVQYLQLQKEDPMLPCCPDDMYKGEWGGWSKFLAPATYSYAEARRKTKALGICGIGQYRQEHRLDPKLPATPERHYKDEWIGWDHFFCRNEVTHIG